MLAGPGAGRDGGVVPTRQSCVEFAGVLRRHGVQVSTDQVVAFHEALHLLGELTAGDVFAAGRCLLTMGVADHRPYALAFTEYFLGTPDLDALPPAPSPPAAVATSEAEQPGQPPMDLAVTEQRLDLLAAARVVASEREVLRTKAFSAMTAQDRRQLVRLMRDMQPRLERRLTRRRASAAHGRYLDPRRTMRKALATEGEPIRLGRRRRRLQQRPVVLVVDVSGSMAPYAHAILLFGHALMQTGSNISVFTAGTRLHEVTGHLRRRSVDGALDRVGKAVADWDGGTRLATSFGSLLDRDRPTSAVRGASVIICSDGLDRDDPRELADVMSRLARRAHRVVWLNPLKADPRYEPLARGMAAALPHVDHFRSGHNLASLEEIAGLIGDQPRRRAGNRSQHA